MVTILGISCFYHDASAVLLRDGLVVAAAAEERFSRIKHDPSFPASAITFCCAQAGLEPRDVDYVVYYEKPFLKFERIVLTALRTFPRSGFSFKESMLVWMREKLWIRQIIHAATGIPDPRIMFCEHHLSHAASAFLCSPYRDAAILTVDGVGEWATTTFGRGEDTRVTLTHELRFPHSLGLLYSTFTAFLGFEVNEGEYKVMGMAPYGVPRYADRIREIVHLRDDGSFSLDMRYFAYQYSARKSFSGRFVRAFGPPRDPVLADDLDQRYADIAASIQRVTEDIMVHLCHALHARVPVTRLCLAGGVALNCVANEKILSRTPFTDLYVQPAAGDGGGALGAALYMYHHVEGRPRAYTMRSAALGPAYTERDIRACLDERHVAHTVCGVPEEQYAIVADLLARGKVVGWFQGAAEWGPRALGNRSILADARDPAMKDIVNTRIKFREPFRPFAPAVLEEHAAEYFLLAGSADLLLYDFMLCTGRVREEKRSVIPAVTHVDGTARVQVVRSAVNPAFHGLLRAFRRSTGVPVLLNTSFNLKGEPVVNTPADALSTFDRSGMDALVMGPCIIEKAPGRDDIRS